MDSAVQASSSTQESFGLQNLEFNAAQMADILDENILRDSCCLHEDRDLIFEEGDEEGGDQSVGPDFECNGIEVVWLANNELNNTSTDKESEMFYPAVEVGANETATIIGKKICRTADTTPPDAGNDNGDQLSPIRSRTVVNGQDRPESSQIEARFEHAQIHDSASEVFAEFNEANIRQQQHMKPSNFWMPKLHETDVAVSSGTTFTVDQLEHANTYIADSQTLSAQFSNECSPFVDNGKSVPQRKPVGGYVLPQNSFQLPVSNFHQNGVMTTNPNHLFQQQQQQQNYGFSNSASTYLTYAIMPNHQMSQNFLPMHVTDGLPFNQAFNVSNNFDVNASVFSYSMGQNRLLGDVTQSEVGPPVGSPITFEANRETTVPNSCHDFVPLQQPICTYPSCIGPLTTSPFINQSSSGPSSYQQCTTSINAKKPCVSNNHADTLLQTKSQSRCTSRKGNQDLTTSFQMPFLPTYSHVNTGVDSAEDQNDCVTSSSQDDCSPPILMPSALAVQDPQDGDNDAFVPLTPQASLLQFSQSESQEFCGLSLSSANVTTVKSLDDVAVFKTPRRIGDALLKHAYYARKIPPTIDVLVRNSVKNFEMTTTLPNKMPLSSLQSQSRFSNDNLSRKDQLRIPYFPNPKYPNMVDVNFRRRPGSKRSFRRRHLCDQTREVIARVCAYFREFSKRYSALGNNIAGTPFENPDRMASHATGFTIPTIRRCGERMEAVPFCTYRHGAVPTDEEITNLSLTFAEEPWYHVSKSRFRPMNTIRRKPRKRSTPSIVSISEAEESIDENIIDDRLEPDEVEESDGVPKRRRSQRILNQRRAKLLNRLRAKNHERKTSTSLRIGKRANAEECVNLDADASVMNSEERVSGCAVVTKFPRKSALRKRRNQAHLLELNLDAEYDEVPSSITKHLKSTTRMSAPKSTNSVGRSDVTETPTYTLDTATLMERTDPTVVVDLRATAEEIETSEIVVMS